jgi:hypothetical protein
MVQQFRRVRTAAEEYASEGIKALGESHRGNSDIEESDYGCNHGRRREDAIPRRRATDSDAHPGLGRSCAAGSSKAR